MTSLNRVVVEWSGPQVVGRAVNVLHFSASDNVAPPVAAIRAAYQNLNVGIPTGVTITVPATGDVIDDTTGNLTGVWTAPTTTGVLGTASASCPAGVGACVGWTTGGIVSGKKGPRKLRGRTFIVPLSQAVFDIDGTLAPAMMTALGAFADALQASGPLAVWHRPSSSVATDGNSYGVIQNRVRDKVAFLSSRRD